ncbi:unnamed protein product [Ixodes persulcatus]
MNSLFGRKKSSSTLCEGREWQEDNDRRRCLKVAANAIIVRSKKEQKMAFTETTKRAVEGAPGHYSGVFGVHTNGLRVDVIFTKPMCMGKSTPHQISFCTN